MSWVDRSCLDSKLTHNTAWDTEAAIANNIAVRKWTAGLLVEEFSSDEPGNWAQPADFGQS